MTVTADVRVFRARHSVTGRSSLLCLVGANVTVTADVRVFRARHSVTGRSSMLCLAVCYLNTQTLKCTDIHYFIFFRQV